MPEQGRRTLVLDDCPPVVDLIGLALRHGPFAVRAAGGLAEAEAILAAWPPDLAVVDMDHADSAALIRRLGATNTMAPPATPVLGLTRRGDLRTKLRAFELGVDDIVATPFAPGELLARSIVLTRRAHRGGGRFTPTITLGGVEIDILARQVSVGGQAIRLSGIELCLLYVLASRAGQAVSHAQLIEAVWGPDFAGQRSVLDRHVRSLRFRLRGGGPGPCCIAAVPGRGYRFDPGATRPGA